MKKEKKTNVKVLQKKAEGLWKDICYLRDGHECQVKKHYPDFKLNHTNIIQVDHCFERGDKNLFLEPANGTPICSTCNMLKSYKRKALDRLVDLIVRKREGDEKYKEMLNIAVSGGPNLGWKDRQWLEFKIGSLEAMKLFYLKKNELK